MAESKNIVYAYYIMRIYINLRSNFAQAVIVVFLINALGPLPIAQAQEFRLPVPGVMVHLSPPLDPPILKGIKVHPDNPFHFDFILDQGDGYSRHPERSEGSHQEQLKSETTKLIKYFLASLTIPENDLWVNLSPYEKNRIIPQSFGLTEMGRDLLAEDYMLKQITASLIYPEDGVGKKFWKRVYEESAKRYGTTNIPVNTFNKVWIIPEKAVVYENAQAGTAYVVESKLKVMLEEDYLSLQKHNLPPLFHKEGVRGSSKDINSLSSQIIREIVIPELTREVNANKNFAQLRQVYNSLILATWYKKKIKDSILEKVYADKKKVAGVGYDQANDIERIYQRYLQAFKKGVFNYIKEEPSDLSLRGAEGDEAISKGTTIPRKYFSGGTDLDLDHKGILSFTANPAQISLQDVKNYLLATVDLVKDTFPTNPGDLIPHFRNVLQAKWHGSNKEIPIDDKISNQIWTPVANALKLAIKNQKTNPSFTEKYNTRIFNLMLDMISRDLHTRGWTSISSVRRVLDHAKGKKDYRVKEIQDKIEGSQGIYHLKIIDPKKPNLLFFHGRGDSTSHAFKEIISRLERQNNIWYFENDDLDDPQKVTDKLVAGLNEIYNKEIDPKEMNQGKPFFQGVAAYSQGGLVFRDGIQTMFNKKQKIAVERLFKGTLYSEIVPPLAGSVQAWPWAWNNSFIRTPVKYIYYPKRYLADFYDAWGKKQKQFVESDEAFRDLIGRRQLILLERDPHNPRRGQWFLKNQEFEENFKKMAYVNPQKEEFVPLKLPKTHDTVMQEPEVTEKVVHFFDENIHHITPMAHSASAAMVSKPKKNSNRRQFLKISGFAGLGLAALGAAWKITAPTDWPVVFHFVFNSHQGPAEAQQVENALAQVPPGPNHQSIIFIEDFETLESLLRLIGRIRNNAIRYHQSPTQGNSENLNALNSSIGLNPGALIDQTLSQLKNDEDLFTFSNADTLLNDVHLKERVEVYLNFFHQGKQAPTLDDLNMPGAWNDGLRKGIKKYFHPEKDKIVFEDATAEAVIMHMASNRFLEEAQDAMLKAKDKNFKTYYEKIEKFLEAQYKTNQLRDRRVVEQLRSLALDLKAKKTQGSIIVSRGELHYRTLEKDIEEFRKHAKVREDFQFKFHKNNQLLNTTEYLISSRVKNNAYHPEIMVREDQLKRIYFGNRGQRPISCLTLFFITNHSIINIC